MLLILSLFAALFLFSVLANDVCDPNHHDSLCNT